MRCRFVMAGAIVLSAVLAVPAEATVAPRYCDGVEILGASDEDREALCEAMEWVAGRFAGHGLPYRFDRPLLTVAVVARDAVEAGRYDLESSTLRIAASKDHPGGRDGWRAALAGKVMAYFAHANREAIPDGLSVSDLSGFAAALYRAEFVAEAPMLDGVIAAALRREAGRDAPAASPN